MESKNPVFAETVPILIGQLVCVPVMIGIFYLMGYYDRSVLLGGILGGVLVVANFFFMAIGTSLAADRAEDQNVKGGMAVINMSRIIRFIILFIVLLAAAKSKRFHLLAMALPFVFQWPILMLSEFFRKAGKNKS